MNTRERKALIEQAHNLLDEVEECLHFIVSTIKNKH